MPPKSRQTQNPNRQAWQWADTTEPARISQQNVETAYRIRLKACPRDGRRNCKNNPNCLVGLGESQWLGEIDDEAFQEIEDPNNERRAEGSFVGLKNLGATCYVNTFLQVWFHNQEFRSAMYQYLEPDIPKGDRRTRSPPSSPKKTSPVKSSPPSPRKQTGSAHGEDVVSSTTGCLQGSPKKDGSPPTSPKKPPPPMEKDEDLMPTTVCGHLQFIFALLQNSSRRYIDPSAFIQSLGLDTALQQDAQEFSKLLMSLLEDSTRYQPNPWVRDIMQQFRGQYAYVTRCNRCFQGSSRPSQFYELDLNIQGHTDLSQCVEEFLQEEKLEGDNQYFCSFCQSKQNAARLITLLSLPRVLNLQLLRFVFDRNTGHKKKLNNYVRFPEVLDMSRYLRKPENEVVYELQAVLIHRGHSAYSGHYIAHIKDKASSCWYKFNDEEIQKMEGKKLQLGCEEDIEGGQKQPKKPKLQKGSHASRNAYMLVYNRRMPEGEVIGDPLPVETAIPDRLMQMVHRDNQKFEEWVREMKDMRQQSVVSGKARHQEITELCDLMPAEEGETYEWISTDWLREWLSESNAPRGVDNSKLTCTHGRADPHKVSDMKRISKQAAEMLYSKYGGGPHLSDDASLCWECVRQTCAQLHAKARVAEDHKFITSANREKVDRNKAYWVGKDSLRVWRQLAMEKLAPDSQGQGNGENGTQADGSEPTSSQGTKSSQGSNHGSMENGDDDITIFNEDIICDHGNLLPDESCRRLVSEAVWRRLQAYFTNVPGFRGSQSVCQACLLKDKEGEQREELHKLMAAEQKAALLQLYQDKNRPAWDKKQAQEFYIVSKVFVEEWRQFIKQPLRYDPVSNIGNVSLLCPHMGLLYRPELIGTDPSNPGLLVWPAEWAIISKTFLVDHTIRVIREDVDRLVSKPALCEECLEARVLQEDQERREYSSATIYIRKITSKEEKMASLQRAELNLSSSEEENDPDFQQMNTVKKRKIAKEVTANCTAAASINQVRRSSRHRRTRGEKQFTISSGQTLRDLKIQVMNAFSVAPFDQHLILNGRMLVDDVATLGSLDVIPGSVLLLKVDEPVEDPMMIEDFAKASVPEEGFKGTGLLGVR
ncbi:ubiquitin carboxyl-terminal hydrolase 48-like [Branchiostoma floridae]|uniref:Ubiquitin carboxyl-terminal hydrolase 48 n=1 Tax=Branchiostoma floridae TaxID=7739 RepID=A0A9J7MCX0_BRAFL|nr:ubiquitin carboxyl-terminal hydrolase 48-like [Branchiostoma floridae]